MDAESEVLVRAQPAGLAPSEGVDLLGVFMLPPCFVSVVTFVVCGLRCPCERGACPRSMVAKLKLKRIDGRAPPGVELAA
jgi:hypothetical protein